jgi:hypothetical protein
MPFLNAFRNSIGIPRLPIYRKPNRIGLPSIQPFPSSFTTRRNLLSAPAEGQGFVPSDTELALLKGISPFKKSFIPQTQSSPNYGHSMLGTFMSILDNLGIIDAIRRGYAPDDSRSLFSGSGGGRMRAGGRRERDEREPFKGIYTEDKKPEKKEKGKISRKSVATPSAPQLSGGTFKKGKKDEGKDEGDGGNGELVTRDEITTEPTEDIDSTITIPTPVENKKITWEKGKGGERTYRDKYGVLTVHGIGEPVPKGKMAEEVTIGSTIRQPDVVRDPTTGNLQVLMRNPATGELEAPKHWEGGELKEGSIFDVAYGQKPTIGKELFRDTGSEIIFPDGKKIKYGKWSTWGEGESE